MMQVFEKLEAENQDENCCLYFMEKCMLAVNGTPRDYEKTEFFDEEYNKEEYIKWFQRVCNPSKRPIFISIANSSGHDKIFDHAFTLFQDNEKVYRVDCYVDEYKPRITEWRSWKEDMEKLLRIPPGEDRVSLYNKIFGVNENIHRDTEFEMDVEIHH